MKRKNSFLLVIVLVVSLLYIPSTLTYGVQSTASTQNTVITPTDEEPEGVSALLRFNTSEQPPEEGPQVSQADQTNSYSMLVVLWLIVVVVIGSGATWLIWRKRRSRK